MNNRVNFASSKVSTKAVVATFGVFVSALFWLVIATYPDFFLINPWSNTDSFRGVVLTVTMIGWIAISTGPLVIFLSYALGYAKALKFLPTIALIWPASLLINHISLFIQENHWYTGYLIDYPIFIATDILLPILLIAVWTELRPAYQAHHSTGAHIK